MSSYQRISVVPSGAALGAEIRGVGLTGTIPDDTFAEIRKAWLEHSMVYFRDQAIAPGDQVAFARRFGELDVYPFVQPVPGHPEVIPIVKEPEGSFNFGGAWHTDTAYTERPPMATMLHAVQTPSHGGDTMFASGHAAWDALPDEKKSLLEGVRGIFTPSKVHGKGGYYSRADYPMDKAEALDPEFRVEHPVCRTHPETGRKALYFSAPHMEGFSGFSEDEGRELLGYLFGHMTQNAFVFRLKWSPKTVAIWDNRCVQHYALNDYDGERRVMHRITIRGDRPR
jgi:taurine dioxygenase